MEIFALSDVDAPCHETLGRSRKLSKHVARGEPPRPDLIFVRVELRPHFPFSPRLKFSFIRLRAAVQLKFHPASRAHIQHREKRQLRIRLFVPEITNGKDKIGKKVA